MKFWYTDEDGGEWKLGTDTQLKTALELICTSGLSPLSSLRFLDGSEFDKYNGERKPEDCTFNRRDNEGKIDQNKTQ